MGFKPNGLMQTELTFMTKVWVKFARIVPGNYQKFINVLCGFYLLLLILDIGFGNGWNPIQWNYVDKFFNILVFASCAWLFLKYKEYVARRGDPTIGLTDIDYLYILNYKYMSRAYTIVFWWVHVVTPFAIVTLALAPSAVNVVGAIRILFTDLLFVHCFVFLDLGRPSSTVWQDIKARQKTREKFTIPAFSGI